MILKKYIPFLFTFLASVGTLSDVQADEISIFSDISPSLAESKQITNVVVRSGQEIAQGVTSSQIAGKWQSDWGPVFFNSDLTGYWNQSAGTGRILGGSYNPQTRQLVFRYYQPWNNKNGTVTMTLSADGRQLSGDWTQGIGLFDSGSWTMTRGSVKSTAKYSSCSSMIRDYNSLNSKKGRTIQSGADSFFRNLVCYNIYWTEISPQGKRICKTLLTGFGGEVSRGNIYSENCVWK